MRLATPTPFRAIPRVAGAASRASSISPTAVLGRAEVHQRHHQRVLRWRSATCNAPKVPKSGIGIIDLFGRGLQGAFDLATGVVNGLIDAGRFIVLNGIKQATQPVLDKIAGVADAPCCRRRRDRVGASPLDRDR